MSEPDALFSGELLAEYREAVIRCDSTKAVFDFTGPKVKSRAALSLGLPLGVLASWVLWLLAADGRLEGTFVLVFIGALVLVALLSWVVGYLIVGHPLTRFKRHLAASLDGMIDDYMECRAPELGYGWTRHDSHSVTALYSQDQWQCQLLYHFGSDEFFVRSLDGKTEYLVTRSVADATEWMQGTTQV